MSTELSGADSVVAQLGNAAVDAARVALMAPRLRGLAGLLIARGLKVVIRSPMMTVSDPAAVKPDELRDCKIDTVLAQSVVLQATDEGLLWYLLQPEPAGRPPTLQPLCSGNDLDQAASRIAQVLADKLAAAES